jgi:hypothetical protein
MGSTSTQATLSAPTSRSICSIDRAAACSPVIPSGSRYGYDMGTR